MSYTKSKPKKDSLLDFNNVSELKNRGSISSSKLSIQAALNVINAAVTNTT